MRQQFIPFSEAATEEDAAAVCPWAAFVLPADGGWQVFESWVDAENWSNQR